MRPEWLRLALSRVRDLRLEDSWPVFWPVRIRRLLEGRESPPCGGGPREPALRRGLLACCARLKAALSSDQAGAALDRASASRTASSVPLAVEQCGGRTPRALRSASFTARHTARLPLTHRTGAEPHPERRAPRRVVACRGARMTDVLLRDVPRVYCIAVQSSHCRRSSPSQSLSTR